MRKQLAKEEGITVEGVVEEALANATFKVLLDNGHTLLAYLAGSMRQNKIRVLPQDRVLVEMSPYDITRGRIKYRYK